MKKIDSALAINKQGMVYFAQKEFEKAIEAYQSAIDLRPDYVDAYYNLGLALTKAKRREEALNAYDALIALSPEHLGGRFQLGCLWMERGNYKTAIEHFLVIEKTHPQHVETLMNLAACYLSLGYFNEAKSRYLRALDIMPADTQVLFNLGVISMQQGRIKEAIVFYLQALKIDENFHDAHNNLGVAYLAMNDSESALLHFRAALHIRPNNEAVRHTVNILTREKKLSTSPPEYIRSLFDSYANHYDPHLLQALHYQVPQHLFQMVSEFICHPERSEGSPASLGDPSSQKTLLRMTDFKAAWDVLDLGCGTGLSGELFRGYSKRLIGVDLSAKMLNIAAQKQIYDELVESDILPFLANKITEYDLIVAGDVVVYFGDLAAIFAAVSQALKPNGLFVFNAEIDANENYHMTESGRFAHLKSYLDQLAFKSQLRLIQYRVDTMRTQDEAVVQGHYYLLQRQA